PPRRARRAAAPARARLRRARRGPAACRGAGALASGARRRLSTVVPGVRGPAAARAGRAGAVAPRSATLPRMTPSPGPILELLVSTQPGGGPQHVLAVATWLRARRWRPIVAGPRDGALFDRFRESGIETVELATDRLRPRTLLALRRLVSERGVSLIHSHGKGAGLYGRLVGCAARFDPVKRLDLLLRAAARVTDTTLRVVLIGRGDEERRLRALAVSLGLGGRVVFAGEIVDAARLFPAFDVYAAPSAKEGMPLAVLEAMALGVPVLASDIAAHL